MTRNRGLGLDELMIINPGVGEGAVFLGEDGVLYRIRRLEDAARGRRSRAEVAPRLLLGDDKVVYRVRRCGCRPGSMTGS